MFQHPQYPWMLADVDYFVELPGGTDVYKRQSEDIFGTEISYNGLTVKIPLVGRHQVENTVGVITAARALGISDEFIKKGIESTVIHARMEIISRSPVIMLDGGHNPDVYKRQAYYTLTNEPSAVRAALKKAKGDFLFFKGLSAREF